MTFESFIFIPMSVEHYENFPVASFLLPAHLRPAVEAIYYFARSADDIADEGDDPPETRLNNLREYQRQLDLIEQGVVSQDIHFLRLASVIREYQLPIKSFRDLISAFSQDVVTKRYATFTELMDYCSRSADPVGTLMLHLYGAATEQNLCDSNAICSALQIINFWQDIAIDWKKDRIYLPQEDLHRFNINESHIADATVDPAWQAMMAFQIQRAKAMMLNGAPLAKRLPGRLGWELRLVVQGGLRILELIEQVNGDVFRSRPTLKKKDWLILAWRAWRM